MKTYHVINRIGFFIVFCYAACSGLHAATTPLPTGKEIVDRGIAAAGGREALLKIQNSLIKGTVNIKTLGLEGTFTIYKARPNKVRARFDIEGYGVIERGCDGDVYWDKHISTGPRILQGPERQINVLLAYFDATYDDLIFKDIRCDGIEVVEDRPCYKVSLISEGCDPVIVFYDKETGLPLREELTVERRYRKDHVVNKVKEYKTINGLCLPYLNIENLGGTVTHRRTDSIEFNVELPDGIFDLPEDVRALLEEDTPDES